MRKSVCTPTAFSSVNTSVKKEGSALILSMEELKVGGERREWGGGGKARSGQYCIKMAPETFPGHLLWHVLLDLPTNVLRHMKVVERIWDTAARVAEVHLSGSNTLPAT